MLFGFDISSISAIIITDQYVEYFDNPSGLWQGGIGAALAGGSIVGASCSGVSGPNGRYTLMKYTLTCGSSLQFISDRIGRRDSIAFGKSVRSPHKLPLYTDFLIACLWWLAGTAVQVATTSRTELIVGRVLNGVCVGITSSQVPVYLAEIAKKDKRGSIIVIQQLAIEVGILIMYFIGYGCRYVCGCLFSI